jgi:predicted MFS family arabinose efflux permease
MCTPVLFKEIADSLHLSLVSVGTIWGMDPLAGIFIGLPAGLFADRFGVKRTMVLICIAAAVVGALRGFSTSFFMLAFTMFLYGFFSGPTPNIVAKVTAQWFDAKRIAMANALIMVAWSLGSMAATMFSATMLSPALGGWQRVMFFWAAPCLVLGLLWLFTGREPKKNESQQDTTITVPFRQALTHVMRVKQVWMLGVLSLTFYGATIAFMGYLAIYLRNIGWTATAADSALTVANGLGIIGTIPMVLLSDKIGSRKGILYFSIGVFTTMLALISFLNTTGVWILLVIVFFLRAGVPSIINVMVFESEGIGGTFGGTAMGLTSTIGMWGAFLAPPIGNAFAKFSPGAPMLFWAALSALSIVPLIFIKEKSRKMLQAH